MLKLDRQWSVARIINVTHVMYAPLVIIFHFKQLGSPRLLYEQQLQNALHARQIGKRKNTRLSAIIYVYSTIFAFEHFFQLQMLIYLVSFQLISRLKLHLLTNIQVKWFKMPIVKSCALHILQHSHVFAKWQRILHKLQENTIDKLIKHITQW